MPVTRGIRLKPIECTRITINETQIKDRKISFGNKNSNETLDGILKIFLIYILIIFGCVKFQNQEKEIEDTSQG
jgi:hypothetical protein